MNDEKKTETEALAGFLRTNLEPRVLGVPRGSVDQVTVLVAPNGFNVHDLKPWMDKYLPAPERRRGTATLTDLDSFITHVNRHADPDSVVFADTTPGAPKLTAVFDYHRAGPEAAARWGTHRAVYPFPLSDEWQVWTAKHERPMTQLDFAQFIEDRVVDVAEPAGASEGAKALVEKLGCDLAGPARLLELSRGLSVRVNGRVTEARNLSTGEAQLSYEARHETDEGQPLKVPGAFLLAIPVFRGGAPYGLPVRLRYRVKEGQITWHVALYRTDFALTQSIGEALARVRAATGLPVLEGSPEQL